MATLLNPTFSNSIVTNISIFSEDAAKDGFANLGSANNNVTFNLTFDFNGRVFEDSRDYLVHGQGGNDVIATAAGDDIVYGGSGADTISTGKGADQLLGGSGADKLYAGAGDDTLDGGSGNDLLDGGTGRDFLWGGTGNDTMTGGSDKDMFSVSASSGADLITDFAHGEDLLFLGWSILQQLPDTHQGAYDVGAALLNINGPNSTSSGTFSGDGTSPTLIFDASTQMLSFDADGLLGQGAAVNLVQLAGVTQLSAGDFWAPAPF